MQPQCQFLTFIDYGTIPNKIPCKIDQLYKSIMITGEATFVNNISEKRNALEAMVTKYVPEGGYIQLTGEMIENYKSKLQRKTIIIKIKINEISGKLNATG